MAEIIEIDDLQDGYLKVVDFVVSNGVKRAPRGEPTLDVSDVIITLSNPLRAIPVGIGRNLNLRIGAAETALYIAGASHPQLLAAISPTFRQFIEFDRLFGAYGPRVYPQYPLIIDLFNRDQNTRQAGAAITRPDDISVPTRDVPCTLDVRYSLIDGKLNCSVVMRSNDVIWGLTYDAWVFTATQAALAYALGVDIGTYTHHAFSLHVYIERDQHILNNLHAYDGSPHPSYPFTPKKIDKIDGHARVARWRYLRNIMEGVIGARHIAASHTGFNSVEWYREQLREPLRSLTTEFCPTCRTFLPTSYFYENSRALCRWCDKDVRHKLPIGTFFRMMLAQNGNCAICQRSDVDLCLDHNHVTGLGRGALCDACNKALGLIYDNPQYALNAARYLDIDSDANQWTVDYGFLYRARPRDSAISYRRSQ